MGLGFSSKPGGLIDEDWLPLFTSTTQGIVPESGGAGFILSGAGWLESGDILALVSPQTTKGDLITMKDTGPSRRSVGVDGEYLKADSSTADGLAWGSPLDALSTHLNQFFGDGSDGDLTVSATNTTSGPLTAGVLTRDAHFNNLTLATGGRIATGAYRLFVRGVLDISGADAKAIWAGVNAGGASTLSSAGAIASTGNPASLGVGQSSTAGIAGTSLSGSQATAVSALTTYDHSNSGGSGAAGGAGTAGAGGAIRACATPVTTGLANFRRATADLIRAATALTGGQAGTGGSSGAGDNGSVKGGGGGGGGEGGRVVGIWAKIIKRSGSTPADCIQSSGGAGGAGGNGGASPVGGAGGGGGAGAGAGGLLYVVYYSLQGSAATNCFSASGGIGGAGGNGTGTGAGGNGGNGGGGGVVYLISLNAASPSAVRTVGSAGTAGSAASGATGGAGGAGNATQVSL